MKGQATKKSLKNKLADGGEEKYAIKRDTSTNFNELVNSLGYVKARTLLKKVEMNAHLEVIKRAAFSAMGTEAGKFFIAAKSVPKPFFSHITRARG